MDEKLNIAPCALRDGDKDEQQKHLLNAIHGFRGFSISESLAVVTEEALVVKEFRAEQRVLDQKIGEERSKLRNLKQARRIGRDMHEQSISYNYKKQVQAYQKICLLQTQLKKPSNDHVAAIYSCSTHEQIQQTSVLSLESELCQKMHLWRLMLRQEEILVAVSKTVESMFYQCLNKEKAHKEEIIEKHYDKVKKVTEAMVAQSEENANRIHVQMTVIRKLE
eukprot:CAMPEP_0178927356 /NCGR_PEP_ID=MMETSP0786-20121207/19137_1 /TAXON_ID=186022 /ORGANISM="Thalassionema frauenfeldii, Strain CCMP 1798" /LENGTH=221 /DNA_ID=CAMNT_0020602769 /DNA_START=26 /DNA_END=688 /DNA_ORIENTATION=-